MLHGKLFFSLSLIKLTGDKNYKSAPRADLPLQIEPSDSGLNYFKFLLTLNTGKCSEKTLMYFHPYSYTHTHPHKQSRVQQSQSSFGKAKKCFVPGPVISNFFVSASEIPSTYCQTENASLFHVTVSNMTIQELPLCSRDMNVGKSQATCDILSDYQHATLSKTKSNLD